MSEIDGYLAGTVAAELERGNAVLKRITRAAVQAREAAQQDSVQDIITALARGDIDGAQRAFTIAANKTSPGQVARAVCEATPPPPGVIVVGAASIVWANPFRDDYGWRCGDCPRYENTHQSRGSAERAAGKHRQKHLGIKVRWITRPIGA